MTTWTHVIMLSSDFNSSNLSHSGITWTWHAVSTGTLVIKGAKENGPEATMHMCRACACTHPRHIYGI